MQSVRKRFSGKRTWPSSNEGLLRGNPGCTRPSLEASLVDRAGMMVMEEERGLAGSGLGGACVALLSCQKLWLSAQAHGQLKSRTCMQRYTTSWTLSPETLKN